MRPYEGPPLHKLAPCGHCPFRRGQRYLRPARAEEIASYYLEDGGGAIFHCHETVHDCAPGKSKRGKRVPLACAGALLFAMANGIRTQAMQLGERLGVYRLDKIRGASKVYRTLAEMVKGHSFR